MESKVATSPEITVSNWKPLYRIGAVGALSMVGIILVQLVFFIAVPPPLKGTAIDWFVFFEQNQLAGLIGFEFLLVISVVLSIPLILALYVALEPVDRSLSALYLVLSLVGVLCFIMARPSVEMLLLSHGYAAAGTEAERAIFSAAGEALIAVFNGSAFYISYVLGSITGLIVSVVMLKGRVFSKSTAYVRIASSVFDFGLFIPVVGMYISIFSVLFLFAWNLMVARRLLQLAREA